MTSQDIETFTLEGEQGKVSLEFIVLDDMLRRLMAVQKLLESQQSEGDVTYKEIEVDGDALPIEYDILRDEGVVLFACDIVNDGSDTVYVRINRQTGTEIKLNDGENIPLDWRYSKKKIKYLYFRCEGGESANVRVIGQW